MLLGTLHFFVKPMFFLETQKDNVELTNYFGWSNCITKCCHKSTWMYGHWIQQDRCMHVDLFLLGRHFGFVPKFCIKMSNVFGLVATRELLQYKKNMMEVELISTCFKLTKKLIKDFIARSRETTNS